MVSYSKVCVYYTLPRVSSNLSDSDTVVRILVVVGVIVVFGVLVDSVRLLAGRNRRALGPKWALNVCLVLSRGTEKDIQSNKVSLHQHRNWHQT
jgi:hypothetical protein